MAQRSSEHSSIHERINRFWGCDRHVGVSEQTNDPGARNNTRERVNGALHELNVIIHSKSMFRL